MNENKEIDIVLDWWASYVKGSFKDPHQEFADRQGISRQEAKALCHKVAYRVYQSPVMRSYSK